MTPAAASLGKCKREHRDRPLLAGARVSRLPQTSLHGAACHEMIVLMSARILNQICQYLAMEVLGEEVNGTRCLCRWQGQEECPLGTLSFHN